MNKQQILIKFKNCKNKRTYLNPLVDLAFEIQNFKIDIKPIIKNGLTYDIITTKIKDYDKIKGNWFKTELSLYEII